MTDRAAPGGTVPGLLTESALEAWGRAVGAAAAERRVPALVLALRGPLGAGKSVLARAVARGAGVTAPMPSPTYNFMFTYAGANDLAVHHLDLYRLEDPDDVWELGWEELGDGAQVVLIEWPEQAEDLLPPARWDVSLAFGGRADPSSDRHRRLRLVRRGTAPDLAASPAPEAGP